MEDGVVHVMYECNDVADFGAAVDWFDDHGFGVGGLLADALVDFVDAFLDLAHLVLHAQLVYASLFVGVEFVFLLLEYFCIGVAGVADGGRHAVECVPLRLDAFLVGECLQFVMFDQVFRELVLLMDLGDP